MIHRSLPSPRAGVAGLAALLLTLLVAACASTPRPVGPTALGAPVPSPHPGATAGADRVPDVPDGPVLLREPRLEWTHVADTDASYAWSVTVENPSSRTLEVTLVVQLTDADGRALDDHSETFLLGGGERLPLEGSGSVEGAELPAVASWLIEYWVRVPAPPSRRIGT